MRLSPGQRRVLLDLAVGKSLVCERGRFFFREAVPVTIYRRSIYRLVDLGLSRLEPVGKCMAVFISDAGVRKTQAMKSDPPRYYRKGTRPPPERRMEPDAAAVQSPLPGC